jgi:hypothetical protein
LNSPRHGKIASTPATHSSESKSAPGLHYDRSILRQGSVFDSVSLQNRIHVSPSDRNHTGITQFNFISRQGHFNRCGIVVVSNESIAEFESDAIHRTTKGNSEIPGTSTTEILDCCE